MTLSIYEATSAIPPLVEQAQSLASATGFTRSCDPAMGRLLHLLAHGVQQGRIGEIGAGCGVGSAWMVSALAPDASFFTVEADEARAVAVRGLLSPFPQARVIKGDWQAILEYGPFALLFADVAESKARPDLLIEALVPGGMLVLDDLTPEDQWPADRQGKQDPVRTHWLNEPRLAATELLVTPSSAVILAVRKQERTTVCG